MNHARMIRMTSTGPTAHVSNIKTSPIESYEERQFLEGIISPNDYLDRGQRRAERWVIESAHSPSQTRRLLHIFAALAAFLYMAVAAIFLLVDARGSALAAALVSLAFMAGITLYKAIRRGV